MYRMFSTAVLAVLMLATGLTSAQTTQSKNGIVQGSVSDGSDIGLIPGVQVTLTNLEKTDDVKLAVTNKKGEYSIEASAGSYELKARLPGFKIWTAPVRVKEGETLQVNIAMAINPDAVHFKDEITQ